MEAEARSSRLGTDGGASFRVSASAIGSSQHSPYPLIDENRVRTSIVRFRRNSGAIIPRTSSTGKARYSRAGPKNAAMRRHRSRD